LAVVAVAAKPNGSKEPSTLIESLMKKYLPASQRTLKAPIHCTGTGLHTGATAALTLRPAPPDTGILFRRLGGAAGPVEIPAHWQNAEDSALCTTLTDGRGTTILTIEHLMSALAGCGIDNCVVEVLGPEVPIMDGSADKFVFLIDCAGSIDQGVSRRSIRVLKTVEVTAGNASARLDPADATIIDFEIDFPVAAIGRQMASFRLDPAAFKTDIARARTFGLLEDAERLRAAGRALGASLDNTIVVDHDRILNEEGLRYADEFVRHKILDAVGDLALAGGPILGRFTGRRSSHALTRRLLAALMSDDTAWAPVEDLSSSWQEPERVRA
jgi:UDP-3-O-[3-hydroxymyristoyl] N-acetylglucosamine deacetylase